MYDLYAERCKISLGEIVKGVVGRTDSAHGLEWKILTSSKLIDRMNGCCRVLLFTCIWQGGGGESG